MTRLRVAHRISRARLRRHGLRLSMRIAPGTSRIRVQITRRTGASRRHAKASWTRAITRAGAMSVTIRASAVRRLIDGRYTVRVTPLGATGAGPSTTSSLIITR